MRELGERRCGIGMWIDEERDWNVWIGTEIVLQKQSEKGKWVILIHARDRTVILALRSRIEI